MTKSPHITGSKSLKAKIIIVFFLIALGGICTGLLLYSRLNEIQTRWDNFQQQTTEKQYLLSELKSSFGYGGAIHHFKNYVLRGKKKYADRFNKSHKIAETVFSKYRKIEGTTQNELKLLSIIEKTFNLYAENMKSVSLAWSKGLAPRQIDTKVKIDDGPALAAYDTLLTSFKDRLKNDSAAITSVLSTVKRSLLIVSLLTIIMLVVVLKMFLAYVIQPINKVSQVVEELDKGNLDIRLNSKRQDEIGRMSSIIDSFADNLKNEVLTAFQKLAAGDFTFVAKGFIKKPLADANQGLITNMIRVQEASAQISSGAVQVADSSTTLANGATQQAAALEEISASMTQMNEQTANNAANAATANKLVGEAKQAAEKGNQQMQSMVGAMDEIKEAGQNISKIIKVIDEIAFQTNLLALNAAVEAARAGQHGKGFAVVAEEVRNLAARSAKAAQETTALIEGSVEKTDNGAQIADRTAAALAEIVDGVTKVSDLVAEIAAASHEQSQGIDQVNEGLQQLDDVNQKSTSTAEESAAIAEELSSQTADLQRMLRGFKLGKPPLIGNSTAAPVPKQQIPHQAPQQTSSDNWENLGNSTEIKLDDTDFGRY